MAESNLSRLVKAGLVNPKKLSVSHKKRLKKLTGAEVRTLIRVRSKLNFKGQLHRSRGKIEPHTFL